MQLKTMFANIPTPPQPIHTRWGTWIEAAIYYATYFEHIKQFLDESDADEAESIAKAKDVMAKSNLKKDLAFIKSNFACLSAAITKIQARGVLLHDAIEIFDSLQPELQRIQKQKQFVNKLNAVSTKNTGLAIMRKICQVLNGEMLEEPDDYIDNLTPLEIEAFKYAPVVSCDVERTFSHYKRVLENCRRSFVFENLKHHVIVHCNKFD